MDARLLRAERHIQYRTGASGQALIRGGRPVRRGTSVLYFWKKGVFASFSLDGREGCEAFGINLRFS